MENAGGRVRRTWPVTAIGAMIARGIAPKDSNSVEDCFTVDAMPMIVAMARAARRGFRRGY